MVTRWNHVPIPLTSLVLICRSLLLAKRLTPHGMNASTNMRGSSRYHVFVATADNSVRTSSLVLAVNTWSSEISGPWVLMSILNTKGARRDKHELAVSSGPF